jgi:hypothetical protein
MTADIVALARTHLASNRRMVIGRALASSAAGLIPVPLLDDWLISVVRRGTIRRIAESRGVDLDDEAVRIIADGTAKPPSWRQIFSSTVMFRFLAGRARRLLAAWVIRNRAKAAGNAFLVGTLFDHYCARLHVGLGLDGKAAAEVRTAIDAAIGETPGSLGLTLFRRGLVAGARAAVRAPVEVLDIASGGLLRRLVARRDEVDAIAEVEGAVDQALAEPTGVLGRAVLAVELQLAAGHNGYLDRLLTHFERRWRERGDDR